ncbi:MAG: AAA family ATPase [Chloroflexi bacterium]|nr:AAA family ATPase [Chloroflexota bacterium]
MTDCPHCGSPITPELRFCLSCGTPLAERCPTCSSPRMPGARFCGQCGTGFQDAVAASTGDGGASPSGSSATMERRLVSILFADLVGFTARSESRDPEQVREFLSRYFESASQVVATYGGQIEKFIGDAVMAVWGTPQTYEDDAERAVRAALDLMDVVSTLGGDGSDPTPGQVELRAAVMTGEAAVTVGATGQGMVAGDLVNTASRLQSAAAPGTVLVDEATRRRADQAIAFEPAGEQHLRGKEAPVPAWRALRVVAERGGVGRTESLEPPFVGRQEELRLLKDQLHATGREGRASLITILGSPGMGKSRLVWEFQKYTDGVLEQIFWHQGRSPAYGEGIAYWALGEMIRRRAGIAESDDVETARPKLSAAVGRFVDDPAERRWVEPRLAALLGIAEAPAGEREELFAAWRRFFEQISAQGTTVLVFEDLHRSDVGLLDFIESLLEWSRAHPILVVVLARPELLERRPGWGMGGRASVVLHLDPVDADRMADLVAGVAPGLPPVAVAQIADRSEGVPLYAVETVRMLLDEGSLVRDGDAFRLADPTARFAIPASLHALIAARLDALPREDRSLLQEAAVLGRTFAITALAAVSGGDPVSLEARLRTLARKELVVADSDPRSPEQGQWGFMHGLVREISYGTLSKRDRRTRHLAAARHFEALGDEEMTGVLASHYLDAYRAAPEGPEGAAVAAQARVALRAAAERALSLHANATAVTFFEQALIVTDDAGERAAIRLRMAEPAEAALGLEASAEYLREALGWLETQGDAAAAASAVARLARSLIQASRIDEARELLVPAVSRIGEDPETVASARLLNEMARTYLFAGSPADALPHIEQGLVIAERLRAEPEIAELVISKSWAVTAQGHPREAQILGAGGLELARRHGLVVTELRGRMNLSNWYIADDPRRAMEVAGAGVELARRVGHGDWAAALAANLAMGALLAGEWDSIAQNEAELDGEHLTAFGRFGLFGPASVIRAFRGIGQDRILDTDIGRLMMASGAAQDRGAALALQAVIQYAAGDLALVAATARQATREMPEGTESLIAMVLSAHAQTESRDADALAETLQLIEGLGHSAGEWLDASVLQARAALVWLRGDAVAGERGHREAMETWRRLDLPFSLLLTELAMLVLGNGAVRGREALAAEARAIADRLGATRLLERLERATRTRARAVTVASRPDVPEPIA